MQSISRKFTFFPQMRNQKGGNTIWEDEIVYDVLYDHAQFETGKDYEERHTGECTNVT